MPRAKKITDKMRLDALQFGDCELTAFPGAPFTDGRPWAKITGPMGFYKVRYGADSVRACLDELVRASRKEKDARHG